MKTDLQIQKDVQEELGWEPMLNATEIGVAVHNGIVTLSGQVSSYLKKLAAEKAARRVKDVKAVALDIDVHLSTGSRRSDTDIANAAVPALKWNSAVPADAIQVKVEDGWITLEGEVTWQYQKVAAVNAVHHLTGVKGVVNLISLNTTVNTAGVRESIKRALERSADVEAARIDITATGSKVILTGKVHSWNERRIAENVAWSSPGVMTVENDLLISE